MRRHVYFYTHLDCPGSAAHTLLRGSPDRWLPLPHRAGAAGYELQLHAQGALREDDARLPATVTIGDPATPPGSLLRAVGWRPASSVALPPALDGDLELVPLGGGGCHLSLMGTYRPPLRADGGNGSARHEHRVVEACVRRFVLDVAQRVGAATLPA
jgi:hypothetical protein